MVPQSSKQLINLSEKLDLSISLEMDNDLRNILLAHHYDTTITSEISVEDVWKIIVR